MNDSKELTAALKRRPVLISIGVAVVVLLVWLLAFFLPQGNKLSQLEAQQQTLEQQVAAGNAKVAHLKHTFQHTSQLTTMQAALEAAVPSTPDVFKTTADYTSALTDTAAASGVTVVSVTTGGSIPSSEAKFTSIGLTLTVKGPYDNILSLINNIYAMPRLTDINTVKIQGGGSNTNRSTPLTASLSLVIFTTAKATISR